MPQRADDNFARDYNNIGCLDLHHDQFVQLIEFVEFFVELVNDIIDDLHNGSRSVFNVDGDSRFFCDQL